MIHRRRPNRLGFVHWFLFVSIASGLLLNGLAAGQDADSPKPIAAAAEPADPAAPEDVKLFEVYRLRHIDPRFLSQMVSAAVPDCTISLNPEANSLIVHATREGHDRMKKLLETIDVPPDPDQVKLMRVYELRHVDATAVLQLIAMALPQCELTSGKSPDSLIAFGTREDHDRLAELIETLDVAPEPDEIKVFTLIHTQAEEIVQLLAELLGDKKMKISIDQRTNSLIASGSAEDLAEMEAILLRLDESSTHEADRPATYQVRVIWLVSGLGEGEGGVAPAEDLQGVIEELAKMDVQAVRQIGQAIINTTVDGKFELQCSPMLEGNPVELEIKGILEDHEDGHQLAITLAAQQKQAIEDPEGNARPKPLASLETSIRAPYGHFVVLGAMPMERLTSVFVVQVVPGQK